ncbi:unnamed protein product [Allacma fusca]|uniref:Uncharacterized protein n=1 Tax=Allacma fusca TaxID=39272 RepID=A0A8J2LX27_9HEXA|nr:unnamed protein product [Allacma fusca]
MVIITEKKGQIRRTTKLTQHYRSKKKKKPVKQINGCVGTAINLTERFNGPNPYSFSCSLRCKHPVHTIKSRIPSAASPKNDDWIPEDIYKRYTETDSRPVTPEITLPSRRSASVPRSRSTEHRTCSTPEPEAKQCQFHQRRILILDLRRVKSVDAITRQNSLTTGTSIDSTYADDDADNRSSSANPDSCSIFHQLSPRNLSMSRSTTPKAQAGRKKKKSKERSTSPLVYERSSSPKILEGLTLPPLHSSVLTLLGQRPPTKPSPRNATGQEATTSPILSSRKKLRRHGRKTKGKEATDTDRNKREGSQQSAVQGETRRKDVVDDPHDTQMSRMSQNDDDEDVQKGNGGVVMESLAELNAKRFQTYLDQTARSLHEVLDEQLIGTEWNSNEMQFIDENIEALKSDFRKYETKFKAGNIRMKEDLWLSLPRTWSRSSATFGIPTDTRTLAKLTPLEYIRRYIFISEHRKLLYSLVFHRYRTMENPTGKTITYKTVQRALTEVLGRNLRPDEATKLQCSFLDVPNSDVDITEDLFRSICAVSERVFGKYSLEDCNECYSCLKYTGKDKNRCHKNQKDQTEKVDFQYVAARIKDGRVNPALAELLQTVFDRG